MSAPGTAARIETYRKRAEERASDQESIFDLGVRVEGSYLKEAVQELAKAMLTEAVDYPVDVVLNHRSQGFKIKPATAWAVAQSIGWCLTEGNKVGYGITLEDCCEALKLDPDLIRKEARIRLERKLGPL